MNYHIVINSVKNVEEFKDAWTSTDYIELLDRFGFPGAENSKPEELEELLFMAISDFEGHMLNDKISEEYSDISLHHQLFNINQLLHKAYNGTFPNTKATVIEFEITPNQNITKEIVLKVLDKTLAHNNIIKRLYADQLAGKEAFDAAEAIVWELKPTGNQSYLMTTSEYWISRDEFKDAEFDAEIVVFESDEED